MNIQLFAQKACANKIALVGILTTHQNLKAKALTKFLFSGKKTGENTAQFTLVKHDKPFTGKYGKEDLSNACTNHMLQSPIWASYKPNSQGAFGGFMGIYQTLCFAHESNTYRYIIVSAIDDTADLLGERECVFMESTSTDEQSNNTLNFTITLSSRNTQALAGNNLGSCLTKPLWTTNNISYRLNSELQLTCSQKVDVYTLALAKKGKCDDVELDNWARHNAFSHKDTRYIEYLHFHYVKHSPIIAKINQQRLMTTEEWAKVDAINDEFFKCACS